MEPENPSQLLELAIAHFTENLPEFGLPFAQRAIQLAAGEHDLGVHRRALNVASAICLMMGDHADAIDYGLQAAERARALRRDDALIGALVNVAGALTHVGMFDESHHIAMRVTQAFAGRRDCAEDVRLMLTTAAHNALCNLDYELAAALCERGVAMYGEISDHESANARLRDEFNWMKAAIELDEPSAVESRMKNIRAIESAYPTARNTTNLRFADALYSHYMLGDTQAALQELAALRELSAPFATIHVDVLRALVNINARHNPSQTATSFGADLLRFTQEKQRARIRRTIASVRDERLATMHLPDRRSSSEQRRLHDELERLAANAQLAFDLTGRSIYRIGRLANLLGSELGYSTSEARKLEIATRLHDVGNAAIDSQLAQRIGSLESRTSNRISEHTGMGAELIAEFDAHPSLELATHIAASHHEEWQGGGFPNGAQGAHIHEAARIAAIAIAYDEATHQRTLTHAEAVADLNARAGYSLDPVLVKRFVPIVEHLHTVHGARLDRELAVNAPPRHEASDACAALSEWVPSLTLFEVAA